MGNPLRPAWMACATTCGHEFARNLWGEGGPMDAFLKQLQMVRTFVTPLWRKPGRIPDIKLVARWAWMQVWNNYRWYDMVLLPYAGIMNSISGGICVIKVSYHKHVCFLGQLLSSVGGVDFGLSRSRFSA